MASTQPDNDCINCLHRKKDIDDPGCVECIETTDGSHFTGWEPAETTEQ